MAITSKGKTWEFKNSIWMLWAILTFGFLNYISFFYVSYRVKQRKWLIAAIIYSLIFIITMIVSDIFPNEHWFTNITFICYFIAWIVSIIHVFKIRTEYLLRLEAKIKSGQKGKKIQSLKEQIRQEYSDTKLVHHTEEESRTELKPVVVQRGNQEKPEDKVEIIDINTASEEEIAKVPGIGTLYAKKVIEVRRRVNGFTSLDDFVDALSIKPHLVKQIKPFLAFPEKTETDTLESKEGRIVDF